MLFPGLATKIYIPIEAIDMREGFEGLYGLVRDPVGHDPLSGHLFLFSNKTRTRVKALVWDGRRAVGVRETSGEELFPLAGGRGQAQRHDATGRAGDVGERSGREATQATQLVSQERVKNLSRNEQTSRKIELLLWQRLIHKRGLRCWSKR